MKMIVKKWFLIIILHDISFFNILAKTTGKYGKPHSFVEVRAKFFMA